MSPRTAIGDWTDQKEAGHGHVVTHLNSQAGSDLEFPLGRHDLGVDTGDLDTSVQAGAVVGLDDVTGKDLAGTWRKSGR